MFAFAIKKGFAALESSKESRAWGLQVRLYLPGEIPVRFVNTAIK